MRIALFVTLSCVLNAIAPGDDQAFAADAIVLRASLAPEESVLVGQRVVLSIDVLGMNGWAKLRSTPRVEVAGTVVYVPPETGSRLNETIDGQSYSGTRNEIWLYPQRAGEFSFPSQEWSVVNQVFGASGDPVEEILESESLSFTALETAADRAATVADSMSVTQLWSEQPAVLHVGDGISRTIRRTAQGIPSLLIKPIAFPTESTLRLVGDEPESSNKLIRGQLTAKRTDSATYIFEQAGDVLIPDIVITWIDANTGKLQTETLEGLRLIVTKPKTAASEENQMASLDSSAPPWIKWGLVIGVFGLALVIASALVWRRNQKSFYESVGSWSESEPAGFRRLCNVASVGEPAEVVRKLYAWWGSFEQTDIGIRQWLLQSGFASSVEVLNELERRVDSAEPHPALAKQLAHDLSHARKATLAARRLQAKPLALPPLR